MYCIVDTTSKKSNIANIYESVKVKKGIDGSNSSINEKNLYKAQSSTKF